mgnify:FL=1
MGLIDIIDEEVKVSPDHKTLIEMVIQKAMDVESVEDAEVSIVIVNEETIQQINAEYRNKNQVTDVISFALNDDEDEPVSEEMGNMLGDIIICYEVAEQQANDYNHTIERELGFLALHGFLHLLGYDHMNEEDEHKMNQKQEEILNELELYRD